MIQPRSTDETKLWTVGELLKWTEGYFERLGLATPRLDAEVLLAFALGKSRVELYTGYQMLVEPEERSRFRTTVERRAKLVPVAYITGRREFYSLSFEVNPSVLIPRPETEHLVEAALGELDRPGSSATPSSEPPRALDLGTGSGCVAVSLARHREELRIDATDLSAQSLETARRNATTHGVVDRLRFLEGDLFDALPPDVGRYRLIVSNPPYVAASELPLLPGDVRDHEPRLALLDTKSPGRDGLGFYRAIAAAAALHLEPGGLLAFEVGANQAARVREILQSAGYAVGETIKDYGGIERVVTARRAAD